VSLLTQITGLHESDITYKMVVDYFKGAPREENVNLEFKSYDSTKSLDNNISNVLIKSVCAFLNSDGGIVVFGSPRENGDGKELAPINVPVNVDDITRKIVSNISPAPMGIRVISVVDNSNTVLIVEVQKSDYRPHQVNKSGVYYMRVDANSFPAPHYFVEALMKRISYPNLNGKIDFQTIVDKGQTFQPLMLRVEVQITIENQSPLQNEEFPRVRLLAEAGEPMNKSKPWPIGSFIGGATFSEPMEILHSMQRKTFEYSIGFMESTLRTINYKPKVMIQFGGRFSPMKFSLYELDLSFFSKMKYTENQIYDFPSDRASMKKDSVLWHESELSLDQLKNWRSIASSA
jgi:hypothetical protein